MTRRYWFAAFAILAASLAASVVAYGRMPETVPSHWNLKGEVDDHGSRGVASFAMPAAMLPILATFAALPWLSPKSFTVDAFKPTYLFLMVVALALFAYMHGIILLMAMGYKLDIVRAFLAGGSLFLALMGNVLGRVRRNFFLGVRTPWTLASERVWADTHRLAAWVFVAGGLAGFSLSVAGAPPVAVAVGLVATGATPAIYSFIHSKNLERAGEI